MCQLTSVSTAVAGRLSVSLSTEHSSLLSNYILILKIKKIMFLFFSNYVVVVVMVSLSTDISILLYPIILLL